jgi:hypothetical protein
MAVAVSEYRVLADGTTEVNLGGVWIQVVPSLDLTLADAPAGPTIDVLRYLEGMITATGAGTYTLALPIPAGASVRDVSTSPETAWDSVTSAALSIGDAGSATGYVNAVNMKTQSALISSLLNSTGSGSYGGTIRRYAAADNIVATLTAVGAGSAGRTRIRVLYALPSAVANAVKS